MAVFEKKVQLRSLLDDTDVLTCTVESTQNIHGHTEYNIKVQRGYHPEKFWHIKKRYRDFATLNSLLSVAGINVPLPPKRLIGNMDPLFVAERQAGLQKYLNAIQDNPFIGSSFLVKQFLDPGHYPSSLNETALHSVSLALRGEPVWEVQRPHPELGWRIRKYYFSIKRHIPNQEDSELLLSWTEYGPDMTIPTSQLQGVLTMLSAIQAPVAVNIELFRCNEVGCLVVRRIIEKGSLRDLICGSKPHTSALKKYACPKQIYPFSERDIALYSCQILQILAILHHKGIPYGQLHAGNICIENGRALLLDIEGGLLGLPGFYRPLVIQHRRLDSLASVDMYCFGHLLYEMAFGRPLQMSSLQSVPATCSPVLADLLDQLLSPRALREALPSAQQLLNHNFFNGFKGEDIQSRQLFKMPGHAKEALKSITIKIEERLRHDQKIFHHQRRLARVQEMLSSEEEKKRRKNKWKLKEKERQQQQKQSQQTVNGKSPERSDSPASTSTATSAGTVTPPYGRNDSLTSFAAPLAPALPSPLSPVQATSSVPPPPPPPSALPSPVVAPERSALLNSISAFNKSNLRRVSNPR
ncbi:PX domain-containing protein kinase-like protein [Frankliniella fusca]|uniref:PX domain-containing protein kinase-like protein n=1 Tax=Frankliniella fusca TaxID=407009 RepID=A0AAE1H2Z2_9NEOP|nr:PX domain-containing protein kinase-like protein [Frankliniella fusca]